MKYDFETLIDRDPAVRGTGKYRIMKDSKGNKPPKGIVPLSVADMEFRTAPCVIDAIKAEADFGVLGYHRLTDSFREACCQWMKTRHDWEIQPDWIVPFEQVVPALYCAVWTFTQPGDGILIQTPDYHHFTGATVNTGRKVLENRLVADEKGHYTVDFDDFREKAKQAKLFFLCSPQNPTGRVWTEEEIRTVVDICKKYDKWIICDEIHCDLLRNGVVFHPMIKVAPDYADRIAVCTAPSKTFNLAGMKTSNIVIHNEELKKKWNDFIGSKLSMNGAGTLGLTAMVAAYREGEEWLEQVKEYLDGNFAYIDSFLKEHLPKAHLVPAEGTYLAWIDFNAYVNGDEKKLEELMQKKAKVALDEGYIFGDAGKGFERINVASPRSVIAECMERILKAFEE